MVQPIRRAAILGAGVMGSGIAAHLASAGIPSLMLDIVPKDAGADRNRLARGGKEAALTEGVAIAREMLDRVRPLVQGAQVSAPFGRVPVALEVFR